MLVIMKNALKERMRRKELYIIVVIGALLFLLCSSDSMTISVGGESLTGFGSMFGVLHIIINAIGCILGVVLSIRTIPNEYERRNSHLVWVRGISQQTYHTGLTLANVVSSVFATLILYVMLAVYTGIKGDGVRVGMLIPAFLLVALNVAIVALFTSVLSIVLPGALTGVIGILLTLAGIFHGALDIYRNIVGGVAKAVLTAVLKIVPDFHGIQTQAQNLVLGKSIEVHVICLGFLVFYICTIGLIVFKRKEA